MEDPIVVGYDNNLAYLALVVITLIAAFIMTFIGHERFFKHLVVALFYF
jgi:hypothetical protein